MLMAWLAPALRHSCLALPPPPQKPLPHARMPALQCPKPACTPEPMHMDTTPKRAALPRRFISYSSVAVCGGGGGRGWAGRDHGMGGQEG